jgi:hypothetical protein
MNKSLERFYDRLFWNPGVFSYAVIPGCLPNSRVFFIVTFIVYVNARPQMVGIDRSFYHWEKMLLDHGLICLSLAAKPLLSLAGFASTNSSNAYYEFKMCQNTSKSAATANVLFL